MQGPDASADGAEGADKGGFNFREPENLLAGETRRDETVRNQNKKLGRMQK